MPSKDIGSSGRWNTQGTRMSSVGGRVTGNMLYAGADVGITSRAK